MKRPVLIVVLALLGFSWLLLAKGALAQSPIVPTPTPVPDQDRLNAAYQTASEAVESAANALGIIGNADNNVQTANLLLAIARGAFLLAITIVVAIGYFGFLSGWRNIVEVRKELVQARLDLADMRVDLREKAEQLRNHAQRAIEALSLMQLGEQLVDRRNLKSALEMYKQAVTLDPTNQVASYFLGELYVLDKQLEQGIDQLKLTLSAKNDYAPAEAAIGYALRLQAEQTSDPNQRDQLYAQAEARLLRALQLDPLVLDVHRESVNGILGGLYKRQGRIDQAIYRYREALKVTPHTSYPVNNLAVLYFMQGKLDEALPYFQQTEATSAKSLRDNPHDYWARLDHMAALLALGRTDEALRDLDSVLAQVKSAGPLESALGDLIRLRRASKPPEGIQTVITRMQETIDRLAAHD